MKRRIIGIAVLVVVAVVGVGLWQLLANLDAIVAKAIEKYGSQTTGTSVAVSGVEIDLREGHGGVAGLTVGNPDGFGGGDAISLGAATIDLDVGSVRGDPVVIDEIRIAAPVVSLRFDAQGGSNLDVLRRRLQAAAPAGQGGGGDSGGGDGGKKIRIERFVFEQGRIDLDASALGVEPRTVDLPAIRLDDIGGAAGTDGPGVARAVLDAVVARTLHEAASSGIRDALEDKARDEAEKAIGDKAKGLLEKLGG